MTRKTYRKSQVAIGFSTLGIPIGKTTKEQTLSDLLIEKETAEMTFDAESSARYQAKQNLLESLKGDIASNLNASRILDTVGTENAKVIRHAITPTIADFVPSIL